MNIKKVSCVLVLGVLCLTACGKKDDAETTAAAASSAATEATTAPTNAYAESIKGGDAISDLESTEAAGEVGGSGISSSGGSAITGSTEQESGSGIGEAGAGGAITGSTEQESGSGIGETSGGGAITGSTEQESGSGIGETSGGSGLVQDKTDLDSVNDGKELGDYGYVPRSDEIEIAPDVDSGDVLSSSSRSPVSDGETFFEAVLGKELPQSIELVDRDTISIVLNTLGVSDEVVTESDELSDFALVFGQSLACTYQQLLEPERSLRWDDRGEYTMKSISYLYGLGVLSDDMLVSLGGSVEKAVEILKANGAIGW